VTRLAAQILGQMRELRVPVSINDLSASLGVEPMHIVLALDDLTRAGRVRSKLRGVTQRPYYELI
jgi:DNA-binding IscR family transcriptional regulator